MLGFRTESVGRKGPAQGERNPWAQNRVRPGSFLLEVRCPKHPSIVFNPLPYCKAPFKGF